MVNHANQQHLFAEERRRAIQEFLKQRGRVSVKDLSELLHVSAVTIRQDLRQMEQDGLLERTHGGAVPPISKPSGPELSFEVRLREKRAEKDAIAHAAAALVSRGDSIALDASTTAYAMIPYLKQHDRLIVVTNSLMIAQGFLDSPQITVYMPGGRLRRDSIDLVANPDSLPEININVGFFGARGISLETGITDSDPDEASIKRGMVTRCQRVVIIADQDKWDKVAPCTVATLDEVDTIITTQGVPISGVRQFEERGITVLTVTAEE